MATYNVGPAASSSQFAVIVALVKLVGFRLIKLLVGFGYIAVITEGLRMVVPALGMKLYNMPFLGALKNYEGWHHLDLAPFAAVLLFCLSSAIWCALLEAWLYDDSTLRASGRCPVRYQQCMVVVGGVILFADACLFYRAMTMVGWSGRALSLPSLICTLAYLAVLVAVCMASVNVKRAYLSLKRG